MGKRVTFEFGSLPPCHPDGGWREIKPDCQGCYVPPRAHGVDQIPARRYTESTQTLAQTLCTGLSPARGFAQIKYYISIIINYNQFYLLF